MIMNLISQEHFRFFRGVRVIMGPAISGVVSLAIGKVILTGKKIAVGFLELSL